MKEPKVAVVTVTYGDRWKFLSKVIESIINDKHLVRFVVVDNASSSKEELERASALYAGKLDVVRMERNTGSAGGFAKGLEYARTLPCDFVLLLDDDNLVEEGALEMFLANYSLFEGRRIMCGFRPDIQDVSIFYRTAEIMNLRKTFFSVFGKGKMKNFLLKVLGFKKEKKGEGFFPIVPSQGFVYGGAFLPIEAVRNAPLPDKNLVLYGDDVEYSWGVLNTGYSSYLCHRPIIRDMDLTFEEGDHLLGLFKQSTKPYKVYYRIRNMVLISRRNTAQTKLVLALSITVWITGLFLLGFLKYGPTKQVVRRMKLILQAVYGGYRAHAPVPSSAQLP